MLDPPATRAISGKNGIESRAGCTRRSLGYLAPPARKGCQASKTRWIRNGDQRTKQVTIRSTSMEGAIYLEAV